MSVKENKMGVMPINKLIINMSLPMVISMLIQALYNVIDSIFVAQIAEDALTAVSLAFPVQNILIAIAVGTGVGVNSLAARSLGEKKNGFAARVAEHGVVLSVLSYILICILSIFFIKPFYEFQTDSQIIAQYGVDYLSIVCFFSFGVLLEIMYERIIQASGKTFYTMLTQGLGAVINIILDPIFIFGYFGCPAMGIRGAAIATVMGQVIAMLMAMILQHKRNPEIKMCLRKFKFDSSVIRKIYAVGLPTIIMQSISSFMVFGVNKILMTFSSTATAVFGVFYKLQSVVFMPVFGLNNGIVPIMGYNFGAGNKERMLKTLKTATKYAMCIMAVGFVVILVVPGLLLKAFNAQENMMGIGVPALRILSTVFLPAAFCIVTGSMFQAIGRGVPSMVISFTRQLVVLLPAAYLLSLTGKLTLVWLAFPIAELFSVLLTVYYFRRIKRDVIDLI